MIGINPRSSVRTSTPNTEPSFMAPQKLFFISLCDVQIPEPDSLKGWICIDSALLTWLPCCQEAAPFFAPIESH